MLSNDDDSRFYCNSRWTSVGGTCSISYVLTSKVCILVILHIIMIMLTKSNSKKKNDLRYSEQFVHVEKIQKSMNLQTWICSCDYQVSRLSPERSKTEVQSPLRNVMLMIKLIRFRCSFRTIWLLILAVFLYGIGGALGFVPIMPELIKTLR